MTKEHLVYLCRLVLAAGNRPGRVLHRTLAEGMGLDPARVSRLVHDLEAALYVERVGTGLVEVRPAGVQEASRVRQAGLVTAAELGLA